MTRDVAAKAILVGVAVFSLTAYLRTAFGSEFDTWFDDAYMFSRYAKHFLGGGGFSWNVSDGPSYGITSPAYLLLVTAALGMADFHDGGLLTGLSFAAGMLSVAALLWLGFFAQERPPSRLSWTPLLVIPYLLYFTPLRYHSMTGMETTLALLANSLLAIAVLAAGRRASATALGLCVLAGYFAFAVRPDNGLYALLLPPLFFIAKDRKLWRYALRYAILLVVVLACDAILKTLLFGGFLPLPFFTKKPGFYQGYVGEVRWNAMVWMLRFWTMAAPCLALIIFKTTKRTILQVLAIALPMIATFAYYAGVVQVMGFEARYYFPSLAFVFLMAFVAAGPNEEAFAAAPSRVRFLVRLLICLVFLWPAVSSTLKESAAWWWRDKVIGEPTLIRNIVQYRLPKRGYLPPVEWWWVIGRMSAMLKGLPPGAVLAASEHGFVGSQNPDLTIIDLIGLHDRVIARGGFSAEYVFSRKPDLVWFPHSDYSGIIAGLLDDPTFVESYEFYPGAFAFGIALRKSSDRSAAIKSEVEKAFAEMYRGARLSDYRADPIAGAGRREEPSARAASKD